MFKISLNRLLLKLGCLLCLLTTAVWCRLPHPKHVRDPNVNLLAVMKSYMDPSVDPCQDFYRYACGRWGNVHADFKKYVDTMGSLDYTINQRMKLILQRRKVLAQFEPNEIYRKVRYYYQSCQQEKKFDALKYLSVLKPLDAVTWPEAGEFWLHEGQWNFWHTLGRLQAVGFNGFPLTLQVKHHNATHFHLELDKLDNLGYTTFEQKLVDQLEESLDPKMRRLAANIQEFLRRLAILHSQHQLLKSQALTVQELQKMVTNVDFQSLFSIISPEENNLDHLILMVKNLDYFHQLGHLVDQTSSETLIHSLKVKFLGYLQKQMPKIDVSLYCLHHMRDLVPLALDYIYEREVYGFHRKFSDAVIQRVFQQMQHKFVEILHSHEREFPVSVMELLQAKILNMKLNIGNLPQVNNQSFYQEYFKNWQVTSEDFYSNHINALRHYNEEKFKLLHLQDYTALHSFFTWPYGSPAFQPSANLLIIPHAYLRFPLFHPKFHDLFLYAELGNTLGHEIMHAFDINGLKYDAQGNPTALLFTFLPDEFFKSLECLSQQRSDSLNEKIADISGFRLAYDSYFQHELHTAFQGPAYLSERQLFFIKFAQFFCVMSPKHVSYDDSHDTPFQRVPQVVANHPDFEKIFNCSSTKGNRVKLKKCNLW
uniref:Peptidase M13 C-terminal domain-containing protein n=1 Tax=Stomoxys calcitrans TaxID=35570 RepID=A0A1I8PY02_STOCA